MARAFAPARWQMWRVPKDVINRTGDGGASLWLIKYRRMEILYFLMTAVGAGLVGILLGWVLARRNHEQVVAERSQLAARVAALDSQMTAQQQKWEADKAELLKMKADEANRHEQTLREGYENRLAELKTVHENELATLREEQEKQKQQQTALLREQFGTMSEEILKRRSAELSETNSRQLSSILDPLKENLSQMRAAVAQNERSQTERMTALDTAIRENLKHAKEVGDSAERLARAITNENKTQGNFGELQLRMLLENMGLKEGEQFEEQVTMTDEQGRTITNAETQKRLVPDVILHFPDKRDVLIDAKMSLKAFEDYHNAETDEQRAKALAAHIDSVKAQVKRLASKEYCRYANKGHATVDFVMMYVFSESALQLALSNAPSLWKDAYDQGVIIAGSQTLYMMLRVLEMTWRQMHQVENQNKMTQLADELINRVQMLFERMGTVEDAYKKMGRAIDDVRKISDQGGKSIATTAHQLIDLGAKENPKRKASIPRTAIEAEPNEAAE